MTGSEKPRILFAGTPEFAATILKKLLDEKANVVAVITAPDKPAGRGLQLQSSAVKTLALANGLTVLQPERLKDPEFLSTLKNLEPDMGIVVAFRMLPEAVWALPRLGTFNLHASLLPAYRGAAPINRAIMAGEKKSGLSTFLLKQEIDTGDLLMQEELNIGENETAGSLYDRMMHRGAELVWQTAGDLWQGKLNPAAQDHSKASPAPKIFREDCKIKPQASARSVHNQVRGLNPYPGAFMEWQGKILKIHCTELSGIACPADASGSMKEEEGKLLLACADEWLSITELQPEGKRKMTAKEFLAGNKIS